jgi:long-chain acyl-CoA synthetase
MYGSTYPHAACSDACARQGVPGSRMGGTVVLTGRAKDTIVLRSGENVEPQPIEDAVCASAYIKHAVLVGQARG